LSYFVSRKLVYPLSIITNKLNKTSFSGYNEPIEWDSQDEIGRLVREYNTMISNLEESREALARNQRELAWREIAKHVAHEIKNPLTPMKLTLQQLQRRLIGGKPLPPGEISKPVNTLLHQVDVLRDIATSFSAFAKMPIPEMKPFNLGELVRKTVALHQNDCDITLIGDSGDIEVTGDKKLMGRIITNIFLNAQQARSDQPLKVSVSIKESGRNMLISIADNGIGISEEIIDKIFLPGFSTKESGSGIGLAVAKHGIEQSGGQLWVESKTGEGTTFYIEIPLANS
jgi:nitrogen fixation/metabolism regulation signal transduction histidine kinase